MPERERERQREREREREGETDRQTDRQTDGQRDRETEGQRDRDRDREVGRNGRETKKFHFDPDFLRKKIKHGKTRKYQGFLGLKGQFH